MSLDNLRARTAKEPAHVWPAVVADFVSNMLASLRRSARLRWTPPMSSES